MKKLLSAALISLITISGFALSLQDVCTGLSKNANTRGDFVQTKTINANGRQLKSSGNFIISKDGIMWKTLKPFPSTLVITENTMIQTAANGKQTVMDGSDNQIFKNISQTLQSVFAGNSEELEALFTVKFTDNKDGSWKTLLTPKDSTIASVMQSLELAGRDGAGLAGAAGDASAAGSQIVLDSLSLQEASSNSIRYEFSSQKYPKELTADEKAVFVVK